MFEDLICPSCGQLAGDPLHPKDPCICGGSFEHIDPEILKALLPFAPTEPEFKFRVWEMKNGVPVALGVLDKSASEEDLIQVFLRNMPAPGAEPGHFKLRAINKEHREVGTEIHLYIPEDHPALIKARLSAGTPAPTKIVHLKRSPCFR